MNKKYFAEFCGTFILVFIGVGVGISSSIPDSVVGLVGIALAFGFAALSSIYIFGGISGSHINPAVTIALFFNKHINLKDAVYYIISQLLGATFASFALAFSFGNNEFLEKGRTVLGENISVQQGFFVEMLLTLFLVLAVLTFVKKTEKNNITCESTYGILVIPFVITMDLLIGGALTGASMNPARSFGPNVVAAIWDNFFIVYTVAPVVGGIIAFYLMKFFENEK